MTNIPPFSEYKVYLHVGKSYNLYIWLQYYIIPLTIVTTIIFVEEEIYKCQSGQYLSDSEGKPFYL